MRVLVTGVAGQLGHDVVNQLNFKGITAIGIDIADISKVDCASKLDRYIRLDITDSEKVFDTIGSLVFDVIIHCAAWTNVDGAEDECNKKIVESINVIGTNNLVTMAKQANAKFIYISTDYVFDGNGTNPWKPDDTNFNPQNYYGKTKLLGEYAVSTQLKKYFVVRISWVFGIHGKNFVETMINLGKSRKEVRVVNDQIGTPTYTFDLARLLIDFAFSEEYGYYHVTNEGGYISWYDFALEIYKQANLNVKVIPVSTEEYGQSIAKRPHNSRLEKRKLLEKGFIPLPDWKDAVRRYIIEREK